MRIEYTDRVRRRTVVSFLDTSDLLAATTAGFGIVVDFSDPDAPPAPGTAIEQTFPG